jgi:uncharacterized membrane protein YoaK (UPF0700 family)
MQAHSVSSVERNVLIDVSLLFLTFVVVFVFAHIKEIIVRRFTSGVVLVLVCLLVFLEGLLDVPEDMVGNSLEDLLSS